MFLSFKFYEENAVTWRYAPKAALGLSLHRPTSKNESSSQDSNFKLALIMPLFRMHGESKLEWNSFIVYQD